MYVSFVPANSERQLDNLTPPCLLCHWTVKGLLYFSETEGVKSRIDEAGFLFYEKKLEQNKFTCATNPIIKIIIIICVFASMSLILNLLPSF